jgi:hypothetical protein
MKALEPVILVRELPPVCSRQRHYLPSLRELVCPTPGKQEAAILSYLARGVDCGIYNDPGLLYDALQPGNKIDLGSLGLPAEDIQGIAPHLMLTDGSWVWTGSLLYYVALYHIRLPERFLQDAARQHWTIDAETVRGMELNWDAFDAITAVPGR